MAKVYPKAYSFSTIAGAKGSYMIPSAAGIAACCEAGSSDTFSKALFSGSAMIKILDLFCALKSFVLIDFFG